MTIPQFAQQVKDENPNLTKCYIALMSVDDCYHLEVEISDDVIGGVYDTEQGNLNLARHRADQLESALKQLGVEVVYTRSEWEKINVVLR